MNYLGTKTYGYICKNCNKKHLDSDFAKHSIKYCSCGIRSSLELNTIILNIIKEEHPNAYANIKTYKLGESNNTKNYSFIEIPDVGYFHIYAGASGYGISEELNQKCLDAIDNFFDNSLILFSKLYTFHISDNNLINIYALDDNEAAKILFDYFVSKNCLSVKHTI